MNEWVERVEKSLSLAMQAIENSGEIPQENMYMLAPILYSQENHMNNEQLLAEMSETNEDQFQNDCSHDAKSKYRYKFHYVSSYLYCYVVAGKIDEFKYDNIMEYVNNEIDLFN